MPQLAAILPKPKTRSFICAQTGEGKTTLEMTLIRGLHRRHREHRFVFLDPKRIFYPTAPAAGELLPEGVNFRIIGRREVLPVAGALRRHFGLRDRLRHGGVWIVQERESMEELYDWLYKNAGARYPTWVVADETFDMQKGVRADRGFRRLIQEGRQLGIGMIMINQRPVWIDKAMLSETQYFYIGRLGYGEDRQFLVKSLPDRYRPLLIEEPARHSWAFIDRLDPERSRVFSLRVTG